MDINLNLHAPKAMTRAVIVTSTSGERLKSMLESHLANKLDKIGVL